MYAVVSLKTAAARRAAILSFTSKNSNKRFNSNLHVVAQEGTLKIPDLTMQDLIDIDGPMTGVKNARPIVYLSV